MVIDRRRLEMLGEVAKRTLRAYVQAPVGEWAGVPALTCARRRLGRWRTCILTCTW